MTSVHAWCVTATLAAVIMMGGPAAAWAGPGDDDTFERDRQAILAMTGDFTVRFDMRETVPFVNGYEPLEPKVSGGHEVVRVAEDTGRVIRLQHMLVVGGGMIVKHWRQDWEYEPASVLVYDRAGHWTLQDVPADGRTGRWAQTVWQTDDSPRYGGLGRWEYDGGVARWTSDETRRPLARRAAVRHPVYDHYIGTNRHAITPGGWVHEQDNAKRGMKDGVDTTFVHEVVLNTYTRSTAFDVASADRYWQATAAYWQQVREAWDREIAARRGVAVPEEAEMGSLTAERLMDLASRLVDGARTLASATDEARQIIAAAARGEALPAPVTARR